MRRTPVDVWLTRTGDAGGEQFRTNLYLYDITSERTPIEWARELAHEYGHYLLPGATNYTSPESWSNGLLGERLFLRWLRDDLAAGSIAPDDLPYVRAADLDDFCARQVTPLIDRIKDRGPDSTAMARPDRKGMDAFTSLLLYADEVYGPKSLLDLLDYLPGNRAAGARGQDFLDAFTGYVAKLESGALRLETGRPMHVYLPAGAIEAEMPEGERLSVMPAVKPAPRAAALRAGKPFLIRSSTAAWRALTASGPGPFVTVTWKRVAP